jgi:hypothetical protein
MSVVMAKGNPTGKGAELVAESDSPSRKSDTCLRLGLILGTSQNTARRRSKECGLEVNAKESKHNV